jgi:hypothetical protein
MPRYRYGRRLPGRLPVLFDYWPGRTGAETFSRGSVAYQETEAGVLQQVANHVLRDSHYETDPIGGGLIRTALLEGQRVNLLTYSEQFDNAAWSKSNAVVSANAIAGPDNASTADLFREDTATGGHTIQQSYTKAASALDFVASVFFKKATGSRNLWLNLTSGSNGVTLGVDPSTGNIVSAATAYGTGWTVKGSRVVSLGDGWFRAWVAGTSDTATIVSFQPQLRSGSTFSYAGDDSSGVYLWGAQLEQAPFASSYVKTEGTTATRAAEAPYFDIGFGPQALTVWVDFIERGTINSAGMRVFDLGDAAAGRLLVNQVAGPYRVYHENGGGNVASALSAAPTIGQHVRLRAVLFPDGSVQIHQSIDGGAETSSVRSAARALGSSWGANRLTLNGFSGGSNGFTALRRLTIAPSERDDAFFLSRGN